MNRRVLFCLMFFTGGCFYGNGFYDNYQKEDLWRLPLIKPYELTKFAGATRDGLNGDNWHLIFKTLKDSIGPLPINVTMINVEKGIIYGYGTAYPCQHFIINTATGEEKKYEKIEEWQTHLTKLSIDFNKVNDVFDLFEKFKENKILKWRPIESK